jgi:hypothetical protein
MAPALDGRRAAITSLHFKASLGSQDEAPESVERIEKDSKPSLRARTGCYRRSEVNLDFPDLVPFNPEILRVPKSGAILQLAFIADEDFIALLKEFIDTDGADLFGSRPTLLPILIRLWPREFDSHGNFSENPTPHRTSESYNDAAMLIDRFSHRRV